MRGLITAFIAIAVFGGSAWGTVINRSNSNGFDLLDGVTWKVASQSGDHVTYVRRKADGGEVNLAKALGIDCNKTTTAKVDTLAVTESTRSGQRSRSGLSSGRRASNLEFRSGGRTSEGSSKRTQTSGSSSSTPGSNSAANSGAGSTNYGVEGDAWWIVTRRSDDHITYTRKNATEGQNRSTSQSQGQDDDDDDAIQQGKLTQIGSGSDRVLVRVVDGSDDEELTEEGLLAGNRRHGGGYPTSELVHPYVKKVNRTLKSGRGGSRNDGDRKHLKSNHRNGSRKGSSKSSAALASGNGANDEDDTTGPKVGDELNGWRVISKSKDHISWDRIDSITTSSPISVAGQAGQLKSLDSQSSRSASRSGRIGLSSSSNANGNGQLIPSAEGELVEGFPKVFNTYSRALFGNESNIDDAASIRTSLTNTSNWNIGDELAGWRVIGKDYRGIIWEKITSKTATFDPEGTGDSSLSDLIEDENLNEEDFLGLGGVKGLKSDVDKDSSEEGNGLGNKVPPGTWYLSKETKNSVTWKRDGVAETVVFNMDDFPRVGDTDSLGKWKVESKSKEHITWVRISSIKDSEEKAN